MTADIPAELQHASEPALEARPLAVLENLNAVVLADSEVVELVATHRFCGGGVVPPRRGDPTELGAAQQTSKPLGKSR